jgi:hypothetical protein
VTCQPAIGTEANHQLAPKPTINWHRSQPSIGTEANHQLAPL